MPPGLALALNTGIISGIPTQGGTFPVTITAYEDPNQGGAKLTFTVTFNIAQPITAPTITVQPASGSFHPGEDGTLTVTASGTEPLTYVWKHNGAEVPNATAAALDLSTVEETDAGDYTVTISNTAGSATSTTATITVVPMTLSVTGVDAAAVTLSMSAIPGKTYSIEGTESFDTTLWSEVGEVTATENSLSFAAPLNGKSVMFWRYRTKP
jgi:hypothetical protein